MHRQNAVQNNGYCVEAASEDVLQFLGWFMSVTQTQLSHDKNNNKNTQFANKLNI